MSASSTTLVPSGATVPSRPATAPRWREAVPAVLGTALLVLCSLALLGARAAAPGDGTLLGVAAADWSDGAVTVATGTAGLPTGARITDVAGVPAPRLAAELLEGGALDTMAAGTTVTVGFVDADGVARSATLAVEPSDLLGRLGRNVGAVVLAATLLAVGAFLVVRRPEVPAGRALLLFGGAVTVAATSLVTAPGVVDLATGRWWLFTGAVGVLLVQATLLHVALVFPTPVPLLRRRPRLVAAAYLLPLAIALLWLLRLPGAPGPLERLWLMLSPSVGVEPITVPLVVALVAVRAIRSPDERVREALRWVGLHLALAGLAYGALLVVPAALGTSGVSDQVAALLFLPFPFLVAAAVLRSRLFDVRVVVNRSVVWLLLTGTVVGLYVLVVGVLAAVLQSRTDAPGVALVATGVVAVVFAPVRTRLQSGVDQLLYGGRRDPYRALTSVAAALDAAGGGPSGLQAIADALADDLRLAGVVIEDTSGPVARAGHVDPARPEVVRLPVAHRGEQLGVLVVAPRAGERLAPDDRRLLADLAAQVGTELRLVALTADLRTSRERTVAAIAEERRRLRRDLHDGLGPALAAIRLKTRAVRNHVPDPELAAALAAVESDAGELVAEVRRVAEGLRPPALDQFGLVGALRQHVAGQPGPEVVVAGDPDLGALPAATEVAAYRIAVEAVTNAVRHAGATSVTVHLARDADTVTVTVDDDGRGMPDDVTAGVGLAAMRERAAEVGGTVTVAAPTTRGTRVHAVLPARSPHEP